MKTARLLLVMVAVAIAFCGSAMAQTYPPPMNLTRYMPVTSSSNADSLGGNPKYAVDGLVCEESRWITDPVNTAHWLEVDLGGSFQIGSANVITGSWDASPVVNFSLQYWTGSAWVNIPGAAITNNTKTQRQILFSSPVTTTKVRFYSDDDGSIAVKELAVFPPKSDGTAYPIGTEIDIRSGMLPMITADSYNATGQRPYLAYDGYVHDNSRWISANVTTKHWLIYDFVKEREVAYAHIYMGLGTGSVIANFYMEYWDGSAWQTIPGSSVTGNTSSEVFLTFPSTIRTDKVSFVSEDDGNIRIKEIVYLPPNGGAGYPRGTGVIFGAPPSQAWSDFSDSFYNIRNRAAGLNLKTAPGGKVTIEAADSSFAQQYNILLNIGTDTYRICNRANEHCLEVAGGSLSAGAVVQEGDYVGRPYQQWRLVAAGSYYELVNVYSGLLLTVNGPGSAAGTGLIQQTDTSSTAQQWTVPYVTHFPKKGSNYANISGDYVQKYNSSHYYNWTLAPSSGVTSTHFQPMWWSNSQGRTEQLVLARPEWAVVDTPKYLIGYNEPNHGDQANMSVQTALDEWSRMEQVKLPLVGPQHDYAWGSWFTEFFDTADAMGLRIDEGGGHIYPTASTPGFDSFSNGVSDGYYANNNRVQWVTEFNWVNWGGAATWTADQLYSILAETLWRYENNGWVKRYQWFAFSAYWANGAPGAFEKDGSMLPLGRLYAAWDGDLQTRSNTWYHIHNRSTHKQIQNNAGVPGPATIDTVNATINWYLSPASSGKYYIVSSDGKRLSYNGTTLSLAAAETTGTAVEWTLTPQQYGWYYLDHSATGKRLDSDSSTGALAMYANTNTWETLRWRFIKVLDADSIPSVWAGDSGGNWSDTAKWTGFPADGAGYTADFSTLNITADRIVTLDSSRTVGALKFGDTSGAQNWTLASGSGSFLTLDQGDGSRPSISVVNTATVTASLAGDYGFDKTGAGTLALTGANSLSGTISISAGIINVQNNGAFGSDTLVNQAAGARGSGIQFQGNISLPGSVSFTLSNDGTGTVPYAMDNISGNNTINGTILMTSGGGSPVIQSDSGALTLAGNITSDQTRTLTLAGASTAANTISGAISNGSAGTNSLTKTGTGTWILAGANTYTGSTTVSGGTLRLASAPSVATYSFDNVSGSTVINDGSGGAAMNGTLANGASVVSGGRSGNAVSLSGGAYVNINSPIVDKGATANWSVSVWVKTTTAGSTILTKGSGTSWANGNTIFYLGDGTSGGSGGIPSGVRWGGGFFQGAPNATPVNDGNWHMVTYVNSGGNCAIYVDGVVQGLSTGNDGFSNADVGTVVRLGMTTDTVPSDGTVNFNGLLDEVQFYDQALSSAQVATLYQGQVPGGSLPSTAGVTIASGATFDVNGVSQTIASLSGAGSLLKSGSGTLTLTGANPFTGATTVNGGTLLVNGTTAASTTTVVSGATLGGTGTAGTVTVQGGGTLAPGTSIGTFSAANTTINGTLVIEIASAASADRLNASGSVTLGGSLTVTAPAGLPAGSAFTIVNKTSAGAVSGTFTGKPQNSQFTAGGSNFIISYTGGDGNDVTLTVATAQQAWKWTHFGSNWNNAAIAGDTVDGDKDGLPNLLEYALGSDPNVSAATVAPRAGVVGGRLTLNFTRNTAATDLTLTVIGTDDLTTPQPWPVLATSTGGAPFTSGTSGATVQESGTGALRDVQVGDAYLTSDPAHPERFLRLKVEH